MAFARLVFGAMHRYGTGAVGTEATLKALSTQDLRAFHAAMLQPPNAALVVTNSTFSGNNTGMDAIFYNTGTATLYNCTLHGNGLYGIRNGSGGGRCVIFAG